MSLRWVWLGVFVAALLASTLAASPSVALLVPASVLIGLGLLLGTARLARRTPLNARERDAAARVRDWRVVTGCAGASLAETSQAIAQDLLRIRGATEVPMGPDAAAALARVKATYRSIETFARLRQRLDAEDRAELRKEICAALACEAGVTLELEGEGIVARLDRARLGADPLGFAHPLTNLAAVHWALSGFGGRVEVLVGARAVVILPPRHP